MPNPQTIQQLHLVLTIHVTEGGPEAPDAPQTVSRPPKEENLIQYRGMDGRFVRRVSAVGHAKRRNGGVK